MLRSADFLETYVDPAVALYVGCPTSLLHACTVIWCLDALASHVAMEVSPHDLAAQPKLREQEEQNYKSKLIERREDGSWQFQVIRDASNALKHAWRKGSNLGAPKSDLLAIEEVTGWFWYFHGPCRAPVWGRQVVVKLGLIFDQDNKTWLDMKKRPFVGPDLTGPLSNWVPVMGLISPTVGALGFEPSRYASLMGNDWRV